MASCVVELRRKEYHLSSSVLECLNIKCWYTCLEVWPIVSTWHCANTLTLRFNQVAHQIGACPVSVAWSAGTHLYTWVERGTVRVECLAQEHNTMTPPRARTQTARSRGERVKREATVSPHPYGCQTKHLFYWKRICFYHVCSRQEKIAYDIRHAHNMLQGNDCPKFLISNGCVIFRIIHHCC